MQDFLITFSVDGQAAIHMMEQLGARATALEAKLNALGRTGGGTAGGILNNMGLSPSQVGASSSAIQTLETRLAALRSNFRATRDASMGMMGQTSGKAFAFSETGKAMQAEINQTRDALDALKASAVRPVSGTGGHASNILASMGLGKANVTSAISDIDRLQEKIRGLSTARGVNTQLGLPNSPAALANEARAFQELALAVGKVHPQYAQFTAQSKLLALESKQAATALQEHGQAFGRIARRVAEGILIYQAFAVAAQGASAALRLVVDVERESRRFELATGLSAEAAAESFSKLFDIAVATATPVEGLVGAADSVAFAFQGIEDPMARAAATERLLAQAGKVTSVSQREVATEADNLVAIMQQLNLTGDEVDTLLNQITIASGGTSKGFQILLDGLRVSAQAAKTAGVDLTTLTALLPVFARATGRTGSEAGSALKTLFATIINDPRAEKGFQSITKGLISIFDVAEDGTKTLRSITDIFAELAALVERNIVDADQLDQLFTELAPPLNPGAKSDLVILFKTFRDLGPLVNDVLGAPPDALNNAVDKINDALGQKLVILIEKAKRGFNDLFGPAILSTGLTLLGFIVAIGDALASLPTELIQAVVGILAMGAALKGVIFLGKSLGSLLGITALITSLRIASAEAKVLAATAGGQLTLGLVGAGRAASGAAVATGLWGTSLSLVIGLLSRILPLLAAFLAIDFIGNAAEAGEGLRTQIGEQITGKSLEQLKAFRARVEAERDKLRESAREFSFENLNPFAAPGKIAASEVLNQSLAEIDKQIKNVAAGGVVEWDKLSEAFQGAGASGQDTEQIIADLTSEWERAAEKAGLFAESVETMTQGQINAANAEKLLISLTGAEADALLDLNDRLKEGKISLDEWNQGQDIIARSAKVAADLTGAFHDQLRSLIPELASAAAGDEALAEAMFDYVLGASDALPLIEANTAAALRLASAAGLAAIAISVWAQAQTALGNTFAALREGSTATFNAAASSLAKVGQTGGAVAAQLARAFAQITGAARGSGSSIFGTGGASAGSKPPQTPILDIGDLPPDQITKLIALATTLRNAIPGETAASTDAIVALIDDAKFLQSVRGIDDRLLRIALEQLTEQMKKANELQKTALSNLQVSAGPLSGLISTPTLLGINGGISQSNGLNFDPSSGNLTIQFNGDFTGMSPDQIQSVIYDAITKAIRDSGRL